MNENKRIRSEYEHFWQVTVYDRMTGITDHIYIQC